MLPKKKPAAKSQQPKANTKKPLDKIKPLSKKQQSEADKFLAEIDEYAKGFEKSGRKEKPKKPKAKSPQPTAKVTIKKKSVKIVEANNG